MTSGTVGSTSFFSKKFCSETNRFNRFAWQVSDVVHPKTAADRKDLLSFAAAVLTFFIAGLFYLLCFEHVDNLGAYNIPSETGLLIPSDCDNYRLPLAAITRPSCAIGDEQTLPAPNACLV